MKQQYIAYYRVSTVKQGKSGLGLESQREIVRNFCKNGTIISEYSEQFSGKVNGRIVLTNALNECKKRNAKLVIAKLDRLSRNAGFIMALRDSGVDFVCADMPDMNTLNVGIFAVMAQHERELISSRTKAALAQKKKQLAKLGKKLGTNNFKPDSLQKSITTRQQRSKEYYRQHLELVRLYRKENLTMQVIADKLNALGMKTIKDKQFYPQTVKLLIDQLK